MKKRYDEHVRALEKQIEILSASNHAAASAEDKEHATTPVRSPPAVDLPLPTTSSPSSSSSSPSMQASATPSTPPTTTGASTEGEDKGEDEASVDSFSDSDSQLPPEQHSLASLQDEEEEFEIIEREDGENEEGGRNVEERLEEDSTSNDGED